jgi:STE24 endopeptidase
VIEERFGFNKTTWKTFILDRIKVLLLGALLGAPLLAGILWFFKVSGDNAWWLCWLAVTLYALVAQVVVPTWIMPLFNRFDPLEDGELKQTIMSCAHSIGFPLDNVFVMDGSKRSGKSNAFFTGFGKHKRVVLYDTLIKQQTTPELVSVLAHEMGHFKKKHILQNLVLGIIEMGLMFFLMSLCISYQGLFDAFYVESRPIYAGLIFFGMLYSPLGFFIGIFFRMMSRKNEYEADRFAVHVTGDSESLSMALKKLSVENLSNLIPHPLYVFFHYTHPPVLERIKVMSSL